MEGDGLRRFGVGDGNGGFRFLGCARNDMDDALRRDGPRLRGGDG